jgi:hypothetical protein
MSQAAGSRGGPCAGQFFIARRQASWKASSARSRSRKLRSNAAIAWGRAPRKAASIQAIAVTA